MSGPSEFPWFVSELRYANSSRFTPLSFANTAVGVPYVIAAQWLYVPQFFEYRGGLFSVVGPGGLIGDSLEVVDSWYETYEGNIATLERASNSLTFWDLFGNVDVEPYDRDLSELAKVTARAWDAFLRTEIPDVSFEVEVLDGDEYGPQITFYSHRAENASDSSPIQVRDGQIESRVTSPDDFPWFVNEWREINGPHFTPLSYIGMGEGISYVIAAQWLYVPTFVEYRGGLFRAVHPGGVIEDNLGTVDDWFDAYDGDVSSVERTVNTLGLWDLFTGTDIGPYEDDLLPMALTIVRAWDALLRVEYPDREFEVKVLDSEAYGPQVTFSSGEPSSAWVPKVTEYAVIRNLDGSVRGTSENGIPRPATPDEIP